MKIVSVLPDVRATLFTPSTDYAGPNVVPHHRGNNLQGVQKNSGQAPESHIGELGGPGHQAARFWLQRCVFTRGMKQ